MLWAGQGFSAATGLHSILAEADRNAPKTRVVGESKQVKTFIMAQFGSEWRSLAPARTQLEPVAAPSLPTAEALSQRGVGPQPRSLSHFTDHSHRENGQMTQGLRVGATLTAGTTLPAKPVIPELRQLPIRSPLGFDGLQHPKSARPITERPVTESPSAIYVRVCRSRGIAPLSAVSASLEAGTASLSVALPGIAHVEAVCAAVRSENCKVMHLDFSHSNISGDRPQAIEAISTVISGKLVCICVSWLMPAFPVRLPACPVLSACRRLSQNPRPAAFRV